MASPRCPLSSFQALFIIIFIVTLCSSSVEKLWVAYDLKNETFDVHDQEIPDYVAVASFDNTVNQTGWAKLEVSTHAGANQKYNDSIQAYAAGFVEGHITRSLMAMHWSNTVARICPEPLSSQCLNIRTFLRMNMKWMLENIVRASGSNAFWHHTRLFLEQTAGLQDGYAGILGKLNLDIDIMGVYLWQVGGDVSTLLQMFSTSKEAYEDTLDPWAMGMGHCSALLRLLPDYSDLYVAQDTWSDLSSMLRILKRYSFDMLKSPQDMNPAPGNNITFSSNPGVLLSGNDFYVISSGLVSQETTIRNHNPALYKFIKPTAVSQDIRSVVANRLAASGVEWAKLYSLSNSGTYNNQWMIVDYKLFTPRKEKPMPGLFTLLEQMPGTIIYKDFTPLLYKANYFGSYNIPFFLETYNMSGYPGLVAEYGDWYTYDKTPRALIFKRDVPKVKDLDAMIKLMRYNDFKHDPLSRCNCTPPYSGENAIAARCDLNSANGTYPFPALGLRSHAATDMKVTTYEMAKSLSFRAVSGPPYDNVPAFQWSKSPFKDNPHVGHPDLWKFPVITFNGSNPMG